MEKYKNKLNKYAPPYLFILPVLLIMVLMMVYPTLLTFLFSVSEVKIPSFDTEFTGIENYIKLAADQEVTSILKNTLIWVIGTVLLRLVVGFWAALTFNQKFKGGMTLRIIALLPWTVPTIVAANLWLWVLQSDLGLLNGTLKSLGLGEYAHTWLADPKTAMATAMVAYTWAGFAFVMIMLLAGLQGIPKELYEAGKIDGASELQLFRYITIPSIKPVLLIVLMLEVIHAVNAFDILYVMTGGGPGRASEVLGLYIYRLSFTSFDFGRASAVGAALLIIAMIMFIFYRPSQEKTKSRGGV